MDIWRILQRDSSFGIALYQNIPWNILNMLKIRIFGRVMLLNIILWIPFRYKIQFPKVNSKTNRQPIFISRGLRTQTLLKFFTVIISCEPWHPFRQVWFEFPRKSEIHLNPYVIYFQLYIIRHNKGKEWFHFSVFLTSSSEKISLLLYIS